MNQRSREKQQDTKEQEFQNQRWAGIMNDDVKGISKIRRLCCVKINQKWTMKSQVAMSFFILFLMIFILLISFSSYNIVKVSEIMLDSQNQLYIIQAQKDLKMVGIKFQRLLSIHFKAIQLDMIKFQKVYLMEQNLSSGNLVNFTQTPFLSLNQSQFQSENLNSWVCYSAFGNGTETDQIVVENLGFTRSVVKYNQIFPLMVSQNYTYLSQYQFTGFSTEQQLIFVFPCMQLPLVYRPQNRSWFIEMKAVDSSFRIQNRVYDGFYMSQPFFNYITKVTQISLQKSLLDKQYRFKGVQGSSIAISQFSHLFQLGSAQFTTLLVNHDGNLLISPYFNKQDDGISLGVFFQNATVTGFDQSDWQQVNNLALLKQITHNCSLPYLNAAFNLLCRWNKIKMSNVLIYSIYLKRYNYYIVILLDEVQVLEQLYVQREQIDASLVQVNLINYGSISAFFILMLGLVIITITIIFKPLNCITTQCSQINERNNLKGKRINQKQIDIRNIISPGVFQPFTSSFCNLVEKLTVLRVKRNQICNYIDQMKYPVKRRIHLDLNQEIQLLEDTNNIIDTSMILNHCFHRNYIEKYHLKQISTTPREIDQTYNQKLLVNQYKTLLKQIKSQFEISKKIQSEKLVNLIFSFFKRN